MVYTHTPTVVIILSCLFLNGLVEHTLDKLSVIWEHRRPDLKNTMYNMTYDDSCLLLSVVYVSDFSKLTKPSAGNDLLDTVQAGAEKVIPVLPLRGLHQHHTSTGARNMVKKNLPMQYYKTAKRSLL